MVEMDWGVEERGATAAWGAAAEEVGKAAMAVAEERVVQVECNSLCQLDSRCTPDRST